MAKYKWWWYVLLIVPVIGITEFITFAFFGSLFFYEKTADLRFYISIILLFVAFATHIEEANRDK